MSHHKEGEIELELHNQDPNSDGGEEEEDSASQSLEDEDQSEESEEEDSQYSSTEQENLELEDEEVSDSGGNEVLDGQNQNENQPCSYQINKDFIRTIQMPLGKALDSDSSSADSQPNVIRTKATEMNLMKMHN